MLFSMAIGLYTSRVIINTLGIQDYGINNVVGGVIYMFGFIIWAMSAATTRYLTFELGAGNSLSLKKVFGLSLTINLMITILIFLLGETIGLWFLYNKLQLPENRMNAAFWVYQSTLLSCMLGIMSVPYNASIIAHEKMTAFAIISIVDTTLKLIIVYLLIIIPFDKLKVYSILFLCTYLINQTINILYCRSKFNEVRFAFSWDKTLFKEMISFVGWNMFGGIARATFTQGLNILLNIFFGPIVNAARGVAVQLQGAVSKFTTSFQTAINPQMTKAYASNDIERMHKLIFMSSKFSFYLLYVLALPILLETKIILFWWLRLVPDYTINFIRIMIFISVLEAMADPLIIAAQANGNIKKTELIIGLILLMILPISYVSLKFGASPESVFIISFLLMFVSNLTRLVILKPMISISITKYFNEVFVKIFLVVIISLFVPLLLHLTLKEDILRFILVLISGISTVCGSVYFFGLNQDEKIFIKVKINGFLKSNI